METFLLGVGVALAIEGFLYAAFPSAMKAMVRRVLDVPAASLRNAGLVALAVGVVIVWIIMR